MSDYYDDNLDEAIKILEGLLEKSQRKINALNEISSRKDIYPEDAFFMMDDILKDQA